MRPVVALTLAALAVALVFVLAGMWLFPADVVSGHYKTIQEAHADRFIERGWLPDKLPPSTHDISWSNNLDVNTSNGRFRFEPAEFELLRQQLSPYSRTRNPPATLTDEVDSHVRRGYPALQYVDDGSVWVFMCKPAEGICNYTMWEER